MTIWPTYRSSIVVILLLLATISQAGTISLDVSVTVNKRELDVELEILVANRGDDTAYRVQPSASIGDTHFQFAPLTVPPEKQRVFRDRQKILSVADMKPGEYPVPVMVAYQDGEGASFNAPAYGILRTADSDFSPKLTILANPAHFSKNARLPVRLQVDDLPEGTVVTLTPHTTPAITVTPSHAIMEVTGGQVAETIFELRNPTGLEGVSMPLIIFAETGSDEGHATVVYDVPITIESGSTGLDYGAREGQTLLWNIGIAGLLVFLALISTGWVLLRSRRKGLPLEHIDNPPGGRDGARR